MANAPPGADESQRIPNEYKLMMQNAQSENLYVFAERNHEKDTVAPTPEASGSNAPTPSSSGAAAPRGKKRPRKLHPFDSVNSRSGQEANLHVAQANPH